jgi:hypothetical protein
MADETLWSGVYRRLKSRAGMITVFKLMAEQRNGYDYVRPWALFEQDPHDIPARIRMAIQAI